MILESAGEIQVPPRLDQMAPTKLTVVRASRRSEKSVLRHKS
jgi:hypothetical protein